MWKEIHLSVSESARPQQPRGTARIIIGSVLGLVALGVLIVGSLVLWADQTKRDADGYFTASPHTYATGGYAITHEGADIDGVPKRLEGKLVRIRIAADSTNDRAVFVGIARERDVQRYLANVSHAQLHDVEFDPFHAEYDAVPGSAKPGPPALERFWDASAVGTGSQTLTWKVRNGNWSVVAMNADGSPGVSADLTLGANIGYLGWVWATLLAAGTALALLAAALVVTGVRRRPGDAVATPEPARAATAYPVVLEARLDEPLSRWLWIVKWLLAIPHVIVLAVLWLVFSVLTVVAWVTVLVTGRYPRGIFDFNLGVLRWTWRVGYYGYDALGTDRYPPFSLDAEPDYPATLDIAYPGEVSRVTALFRWVLAIPHLLIVGVLAVAGAHWYGWSGLIGLIAVIAGVVLAVKGRYPRGLFDFVVGLNRWVFRTVAYAALMTSEYPPFRFDGGGDEPVETPERSAPATA
jgi:hypothetical protein